MSRESERESFFAFCICVSPLSYRSSTFRLLFAGKLALGALEAGDCVVIGLQSTGESATEKHVSSLCLLIAVIRTT